MSNLRLKPIPKLTPSDMCRFWAKVDTGPYCWIWVGKITNYAYEELRYHYGSFRINKEWYISSRISWRLNSGDDPGELLVCHKCNNPLCVRYDHLYLDDHKGNNGYAYANNRHNRKGSLHNLSKLHESDIPEIRLRNSQGESSREIAKIYGVDKSVINKILIGKLWSHV